MCRCCVLVVWLADWWWSKSSDARCLCLRLCDTQVGECVCDQHVAVSVATPPFCYVAVRLEVVWLLRTQQQQTLWSDAVVRTRWSYTCMHVCVGMQRVVLGLLHSRQHLSVQFADCSEYYLLASITAVAACLEFCALGWLCCRVAPSWLWR